MKPSKKAIQFAIDAIERDIDDFELILHDNPDNPDAQDGEYWKTAVEELNRMIVWLKSEMF